MRVPQVFSRIGRAGVAMADLDLFCEQVQRASGARNAGRSLVTLRVMIALLYFMHGLMRALRRAMLTHSTSNSSRAVPTTKTASPITPPPWSSSDSCWAKKVWKSCWRRPSMWSSNSN